MSSWLGSFYPWIKAVHVIAVISWMAALLYMPRLFVYHCGAELGSEMSETFKVMERRLEKAIMTPAMIMSWLCGLAMLINPGFFLGAGPWLYWKLVLVVVLTGMHVAMMRWRRGFALDCNPHSQRFYRFANEVPTLLMIGIVILIIVRPVL